MNASAQKSGIGFTLVELLISVSIILILSGILIPSFSGYLNNQNVLQGAEQLKSDLRTVQNKALTRVGADTEAKYWGLKIASDSANKYYFFNSTNNAQADCDSGSTSTASVKLPGDVIIRNCGTSFCVFFNMVNGDVNMVKPAGTGSNRISLGYPNSGSNCRAVEVNSVGMMKLVNKGTYEKN